MELRKATLEDVPAILAIYADAKAALKAQGIDQWQDGYPDGQDALEDIKNGVGYVLTEESKVVCTACLAFGHEPTYDIIEEGSWDSDVETYGFLHRIAVSGSIKGKGAAGIMFDELKRQAKERNCQVLRGDTHQHNAAMQRVMAKNGFTKKGVIHVEDGTPRFAYELIL